MKKILVYTAQISLLIAVVLAITFLVAFISDNSAEQMAYAAMKSKMAPAYRVHDDPGSTTLWVPIPEGEPKNLMRLRFTLMIWLHGNPGKRIVDVDYGEYDNRLTSRDIKFKRRSGIKRGWLIIYEDK